MPAQKADARLVHGARETGPTMKLHWLTIKNHLNGNLMKIKNVPSAKSARSQATAAFYIQTENFPISRRKNTIIRS